MAEWFSFIVSHTEGVVWKWVKFTQWNFFNRLFHWHLQVLRNDKRRSLNQKSMNAFMRLFGLIAAPPFSAWSCCGLITAWGIDEIGQKSAKTPCFQGF